MFKKLRNRLILINLGITSIVILIIFSVIYIIATQSANRRPPMPENQINIYTDDFENLINVTIQNEKQAAAKDLLIMLIVSGVVIEIIVAFVSYFLAEEAIKPVREAYESQKVFIANASHEIKTPLAAISANLEAADIKGNKWISNVEKETTKLTILNNELLALARTDLIKDVEYDEVNLDKLLTENLKSFEPRLGKIKFTKYINTPENIKINKNDFLQVLNILMDNAIKYCDKRIKLELDSHSLTISNDGAKISEKDLEHIFERFYQVDKTSEGVGLGLSIAKATAKRSGWDLSATCDKKFTTFCLKF
ncbi:HAMP domain-containing histidine kinase [Candidatus Saccharibacteria bacterium]|nr:HAMP domain-containing histidine kinase [Candidatus Saccharibacteria bacterium]